MIGARPAEDLGPRLVGDDDAVRAQSPEHLRGEMAKTERSVGVEANAGTRVGQAGQNAPEVVEFTDERRGSSVAEQLIRNQ